MIYSKFGSELTLTHNCGKHKPKGFQFRLILVKAIRNEDKAERYYFMGYLKADGGIDKLESTVANLPEITLEPAELKKAMQQAL